MKKKKIWILQWVLIVLLVLYIILPLFLVVINSFKTHNEIIKNPLALPMNGLYFENYSAAWKYGNYATGFANSLKLAVTAIVFAVIPASLAGYSLSTKKFRGDGLVKSYFLMAMTVPLQLFLFPLYAVYAKLDLIGNVYAVALIISAINMPLSVMLMRTFFFNIPIEIEEAAKIDGANSRQVLTQVMMPMVFPGIITVSTIVGINAWNEFLITSTFLQGAKNFTVTLGYRAFNYVFSVDQGMMMAGALIIIIPTIIFFLSLQKYVVDGLVIGAVKG